MHNRQGLGRVQSPSDPAVRMVRLERNFDRLVSDCAAKLQALGINTSGLLPMQVLAMTRDEKKKEAYRRKVTRCKERP